MKINELDEVTLNQIADTVEKELHAEQLICTKLDVAATETDLVIQIELPNDTYNASYPKANVIGLSTEDVGELIVEHLLEQEG